MYCDQSSLLHAADVCGGLLKRSWLTTEPTALRKQALEYIVKYNLEWTSDPLLVIEEIGGGAAIELLGDDALTVSTTYPTLTKYTHPPPTLTHLCLCVCVCGVTSLSCLCVCVWSDLSLLLVCVCVCVE